MADPHPVQPDSPHEATVHHRSTRQRRGRRPAMVGELNLTSMIDVIFQLLIFFVVTANFMIDEGVLSAKLPQGAGSPTASDELPREKITIRLMSDPSDDALVSIERGPVGSPIRYASFGELAADLDRLRYDPDGSRLDGIYEPDNPVLIEPQGTVRWQHVVNAFNAAISAKYTNVSFARSNQP
ncbi:ExbD/TolR family protein [Algisphaera agarilytica]|uniref:Biopolymer transport protein ExbD n=1 Tax=Algisphaera agarilytica TaxID=1385975 RepID=A0A7X0HA31_9BACT|nr:biopolymer transporter ExbD [Algisphaera agarilytica]MBB6430569.1 biopolymer transport protein ExbD [Algisphaera agarilytica]